MILSLGNEVGITSCAPVLSKTAIGSKLCDFEYRLQKLSAIQFVRNIIVNLKH